jgi:hypothetical protein
MLQAAGDVFWWAPSQASDTYIKPNFRPPGTRMPVESNEAAAAPPLE